MQEHANCPKDTPGNLRVRGFRNAFSGEPGAQQLFPLRFYFAPDKEMVYDTLVEEVYEAFEVRFTGGPLIPAVHEHDVEYARGSRPLLELS